MAGAVLRSSAGICSLRTGRCLPVAWLGGGGDITREAAALCTVPAPGALGLVLAVSSGLPAKPRASGILCWPSLPGPGVQGRRRATSDPWWPWAERQAGSSRPHRGPGPRGQEHRRDTDL